MNKVAILDIGLGNIRSVTKAFEQLAGEVVTIKTPEEVMKAEAIVLPGVGAFQDGMKKLRERNLIAPLHDYAASNRPLLGICLGMQLLMSKSYEFGECEGLNLIKGEVLPFKSPEEFSQQAYKVPHVAWNAILNPHGSSYWKGIILDTIPNRSDFYFVHSFYAKPTNKQFILATSEYGGQMFCSALMKGNVYGTQFHPEKSSALGLQILKNFFALGRERKKKS